MPYSIHCTRHLQCVAYRPRPTRTAKHSLLIQVGLHAAANIPYRCFYRVPLRRPHDSIMATNDNVEADGTVDVLLTEEDILAFLLSRSGEVKNSELVRHFRRALRKGRHRHDNVQRFPQFVNNLANVRQDANGAKIVTLKKKFQRRTDAAVTSASSNGDVANGSGTAAVVEETDNDSQNHNAVSEEQNSSQVADSEFTGSKPDDVNASENGENPEEEQAKDEDIASKKYVSNDDGKQNDKSPANDEQQSQHDVNSEEIQQANEEAVAGGSIVDGGSGVQCLPAAQTEKNGEKVSLESESPDQVEETQASNDETATADDVFDDPEGPSTEENKENNRSSGVIIVVEDHSSAEQTTVDKQSDEVDRGDFQGGVKELSQRIEEVANKRMSTSVALRTKQQVLSEPPGTTSRTGRPMSTPYDYTMDESQREWTLRASYSDYQALSKLLSRNQGNVAFLSNSTDSLYEKYFLNFINLGCLPTRLLKSYFVVRTVMYNFMKFHLHIIIKGNFNHKMTNVAGVFCQLEARCKENDLRFLFLLSYVIYSANVYQTKKNAYSPRSCLFQQMRFNECTLHCGQPSLSVSVIISFYSVSF